MGAIIKSVSLFGIKVSWMLTSLNSSDTDTITTGNKHPFSKRQSKVINFHRNSHMIREISLLQSLNQEHSVSINPRRTTISEHVQTRQIVFMLV